MIRVGVNASNDSERMARLRGVRVQSCGGIDGAGQCPRTSCQAGGNRCASKGAGIHRTNLTKAGNGRSVATLQLWVDVNRGKIASSAAESGGRVASPGSPDQEGEQSQIWS